jgi:hypothetical protein
LFARFSKIFKSLFAEALERIRRRTRFEDTTAQRVRPSFADRVRGFENL